MALNKFAAIVAAATVVVTVLLVAWPGFLLHGLSSSSLTIGGITYDQESATVQLPDCPSSTGTGSQYVFHGVGFSFHVVNWCSPGGGLLVGSGLETKGPGYNFTLEGLPGPSQWVTWVSPDKLFGIQWDRGSNVNLLTES